jgi:hypothetical protein
MPSIVVHACNTSYLGGGGRKIAINFPVKSIRPYLKKKKTKSKRTVDMAQVEECSPSKHEALNSKPQYHKKKTTKKN